MQHYIAYLPEISKTSAIVQMSERLGIFIMNHACSKCQKGVCL